ncbi:MAG: hypothetical protein BMS9Abin02_1597 [Anaerolineae bacterium]|nr:MAG: hypothetical protein BMS9Abin02_1597 [Anaerolineae bacterium]
MNNQESMIENSINIWRQYSESHSKKLIALFKKNLEQSKSYQVQMQKVLNQMVTNQYDLMAEGIKSLESQTTEFVNSWDELIRLDSE